MTLKILIATAASAAVLSFAAGLALAQPAGGHMMGGPMGASSGPEMQQRMQEHVQRMADDVRALLRLRPDQEPAFKALVDSMTHRPMMARRGPPAAGATTPEMIAEAQARMTEHETAMRAHLQAVLAFYNVLSPDQQKSFDALMRMHHGGMMGGGMMGMGGGHRGMMGGGGVMGHGPMMGGPGGPAGDGPPPPPQ